jgi:hypothetical protein
MDEPNKYSKWVCQSVDGIEANVTLHVNYQYDREADDIENFQAFLSGDAREEHEVTEFLSGEDYETIRDEIWADLALEGDI